MTGLYRLFERVAQVAVWLSGFALLGVALLVTIDVVSRKWLGATLAGSDEISGYVLACASSWAYAFCLLRRSHIRIDAVYNLMPLRIRCLFDILGLTVLLLFIALMTHRAVGVLAESLQTNAISNTSLVTPLWIPQAFWVGGLVFFTATLVVVLLHVLLAFARGDQAGVQRMAGVPSVEEEIGTVPATSAAVGTEDFPCRH